MLYGTLFICALAFPSGNLHGKTIFLSPGHGFYHHLSLGWKTQRGNAGGLVEDFETSDTVFAFLTEYLRRAGADVWPCRCECPSDCEVIVDNGGREYEETGNWQTLKGAQCFKGNARISQASSNPKPCAIFRPVIPKSGRYPLYIWYTSQLNSPANALVTVHTISGPEKVTVSQKKHGSKWRYAGTYYFFAGMGQTVEIRPASNQKTGAVVADAIRIGGGAGEAGPAGDSTCRRSRYEECAARWARYQGAPTSVWNPRKGNERTDDVACRPLYAEWIAEPGQDSLYISYHTNAGGGSGTETYYSSKGATPGSKKLSTLIQRETVGNLRKEWDPEWPDRGVKRANFGELRLLKSMPGALLEAAFHDNPDDLRAERSPLWRRIVSRSIYRAVVKYFHGKKATFLPEPPCALTAARSGTHEARISWQPPPHCTKPQRTGNALRYRLYLSKNGLSFKPVGETKHRSIRLKSLPMGRPVYFRVTALNEGGESFPSKTAGVLLSEKDPGKRALFVHAYSQDCGTVSYTYTPKPSLGKVLRLQPGRTPGGGDTVFEHLNSIKPARNDFSFDFTEEKALPELNLTHYELIVIAFGMQEGKIISEESASSLLSFLSKGGKVFASGAHAAGAISGAGGNRARQLLLKLGVSPTKVKKAKGQDRAISLRGAFSGIGKFKLATVTDWGLSATEEFDVLTPSQKAEQLAACGNLTAGVFTGQSVFLSFPLENVPLGCIRTALYDRTLKLLCGPEKLRDVEIHLAKEDKAPNAEGNALKGCRISLGYDRASVCLQAEGPERARYVWKQIEGPGEGAYLGSESWPVARFTFREGANTSEAPSKTSLSSNLKEVLLRKNFFVDSKDSLTSLLLDITHRDSFTAYINGRKVASRKKPPEAACAGLGFNSVREEIEILPEAGRFLRNGKNVLSVCLEGSKPGETSFKADFGLRSCSAGEGHLFLISQGERWHYCMPGKEPPKGWNTLAFDPSGRKQRIEFTKPGRYKFEVKAQAPAGAAATTFSMTILPERPGISALARN